MTRPAQPTDGDGAAASSTLVRVVASLPLLVPVLVTALALAAMACLLLEVYSLVTVLPVAAVLAVVGVRVVGLGERRVARKDLVVDLLAVGLALGFALSNAAFASQDVVITRDPGTYTVASEWLVHHEDLDIDGQPDLFGPQRALSVRSAGIGPVKEYGHLYAQGAHVGPAVLGVSGRLFGTSVMLRTNALIGGLALLAVYGFARRITGRWGALLAAGVVGIGLPQLAFSRDNYSEPISQLFVFGGLALLWEARRGQWGRWALAGLVMAGSCMARIDAFLVLPAIAAYGGLRLAEAGKGERRVVVRDVLAFAVGAGVAAVLGYLDLTRLAPGYYNKLSPEYHQILLLLAATVVVAVVVVAVAWLGADRWWARVSDRLLPGLGNGVAGVIVLAGLVLASRPFWMKAYGDNHPGTSSYVESLQLQAGLEPERNRLYYENTVTWLGWYVGPLCTALALFGLALLARRALRERDLVLVPFVLAVVITSGVYLIDASIVPDQIWAMRRFLPVVLPGVAVCGTYAGVLLVRRLRPRWQLPVAGAGALAFVLPVLYVSEPFLTVREYVPQQLEISRVCTAVPDDAAVIAVGDLYKTYPMTVRTFCGVPAAAVNTLTPQLAREVRAALARKGLDLYVVANEDVQTTVPYRGLDPLPTSEITFKVLRSTLVTPPRQLDQRLRRLFVGKIGPDGYVETWSPRR